MLEATRVQGLIVGDEEIELTGKGRDRFQKLGLDLDRIGRGRRPLCRACLDWSERKTHLGGALGAALLDFMVQSGWVRREEGRVLRFTPHGRAQFETQFLSA